MDADPAWEAVNKLDQILDAMPQPGSIHYEAHRVTEREQWRRELVGQIFIIQLEHNLERNQITPDMPRLCAKSSVEAVDTLLEALERPKESK